MKGEKEMEANTISTALTNIGSVVTSCVGIVTDNAILMTVFAGGLLAVGFRAIRWAKKAII